MVCDVCSVVITLEVAKPPKAVSDRLTSVWCAHHRTTGSGAAVCDWYSLSLRGTGWRDQIAKLQPGVRFVVVGRLEHRSFRRSDTGDLVLVVDVVPVQPLSSVSYTHLTLPTKA